MPPPYLLVMAGSNGCIMAARYVQSDLGFCDGGRSLAVCSP